MKTLIVISMLGIIAFRSYAIDPNDTSPSIASGFTLVEKRENIALYERWFMYDSLTKAREIKLIFEAKADIQTAVNLLRDESHSRQWNLRSSQFLVLREDNDQWVNYIRYDLPWPVSDHDCVLKYNLQMATNSKCLISFESGSHLHFPKTEKASRLSDIRGNWLMEQHRESIHIEYSVTTIPSSTLPRWVTDPIIRNNLLDTMVKFSNLLEKLTN